MHVLAIRGAAGTAFLCAAVGLLLPRVASAQDMPRTNLPERIVVDRTPMMLNGDGIHAVASLGRYVVGLYVTQHQTRLDALLADRGRKRLVLVMLRATAASSLGETIVEAIGANHTESELESIKVPLDELQLLMNGIGLLRAGTAIAFDYVPGAGLQLVLQGSPRGSVIRGTDLYRALLRAWLGDEPIDRGLRRALVRGSGGIH